MLTRTLCKCTLTLCGCWTQEKQLHQQGDFMKKIITILSLGFTVNSFALIPGVCDVGDAKKDRFPKADEYEIMKECMERTASQVTRDYQEKKIYCSCFVGALSCASGQDLDKANNLDEKKLQKVAEQALKCYEKSK